MPQLEWTVKPFVSRFHWIWHNWERWQDQGDETQRRECLVCGKLQVRSTSLCQHTWLDRGITRVIHFVDEKPTKELGIKYEYGCMRCARHKTVFSPHDINQRTKVTIT
jgi:hypothetical protein